MPRSVKIHPDHKQTALVALEGKGFLTQGQLSANLGIALSTVNNFFNSVAVSVAKFEEICEALGLDPKIIIQPRQTAQNLNEKSVVPHSFVPNLYNKDTWVGRESLVSDLLRKLKDQTRVLWITGISGIGKSTLGACLASQAWDREPSFQSNKGQIPRRSAAKGLTCNPNHQVREQIRFHTPSACSGVLDSVQCIWVRGWNSGQSSSWLAMMRLSLCRQGLKT
jgi:transcriptional regulator with XRE-family HTH domain